MRIKEAAEQSGLTEKAIRLYEEKGLITPAITEINGRKFRDYDEQTVAALKTIAGLRRSFFSLEQIAAMQEDPAAIPAIFTEYRDELKAQYDRLGALIERADDILARAETVLPGEETAEEQTIVPAPLWNVDTLSAAMTAVTPFGEEEVPAEEKRRGDRELHFRRWDEEISRDERELVYQRYLAYYARWEKRYMTELWIGRAARPVILTLGTVAAAWGIYMLVTGTAYVEEYRQTFRAWELYYGDEDQTEPPLSVTPVEFTLSGKTYRYLGDRKEDCFEGELRLADFRYVYHFMDEKAVYGEWIPCRFAFRSDKVYEGSALYLQGFAMDMERENGDKIHYTDICLGKGKEFFLFTIHTVAETVYYPPEGPHDADGTWITQYDSFGKYIIGPADSAEEAVALFRERDVLSDYKLEGRVNTGADTEREE